MLFSNCYNSSIHINNNIMKDEMFYCNCDNCKGQIDYEKRYMLDPHGQSISMWCATLTDLTVFINIGPVETEAEFELQQRGVQPFYISYYNLPLEPFIKPDQVDKLFEEMKTFKP